MCKGIYNMDSHDHNSEVPLILNYLYFLNFQTKTLSIMNVIESINYKIKDLIDLTNCLSLQYKFILHYCIHLYIYIYMHNICVHY